MAPKRSLSPSPEQASASSGRKKQKVIVPDEDIPIAPAHPQLDRLLNLPAGTKDEKKARAQKMKEWLEKERTTAREKDGVHSLEDAVAKFHHLLNHEHLLVRGKPSKATEIIMADYEFKVLKELITDLPEAEREKFLRYGSR